jgi:aspartate carbamoyltransferase regulatory subunit
MNVPSKKLGSKAKDIVKIEDRELNSDEVDKIALIAPNATINIIRNYEVVQKSSVELHDKIENIVKCPNLNCISNTNEPVTSKFAVIHPLTLRCLYCERIIKNNIVEHLI